MELDNNFVAPFRRRAGVEATHLALKGGRDGERGTGRPAFLASQGIT